MINACISRRILLQFFLDRLPLRSTMGSVRRHMVFTLLNLRLCVKHFDHHLPASR
jgi:hypothetical protein